MTEKPEPPPEALLIRRVRLARRLRMPQAAGPAGISPQRWSQIETGYEIKRGVPSPATAPDDTLAHMAHSVSITPEELEDVGRPEAASILREILRQEGKPAWNRLGRMLADRRIQLTESSDPDVFAEASTVPVDLVVDIENGRRDKYTRREVDQLEAAYRIVPGSINQALDGADLSSLGDITHADTDDGTPTAEGAEPERYPEESLGWAPAGFAAIFYQVVQTSLKDLRGIAEVTGMDLDLLEKWSRSLVHPPGAELRRFVETLVTECPYTAYIAPALLITAGYRSEPPPPKIDGVDDPEIAELLSLEGLPEDERQMYIEQMRALKEDLRRRAQAKQNHAAARDDEGGRHDRTA